MITSGRRHPVRWLVFLSEVAADGVGASSLYYNAQGQRILAPIHGIAIRVDRMADGSKKIVKLSR